jgi:hypothetical protein
MKEKREKEERRQREVFQSQTRDEKKSRGSGRASSPPTAKKNSLNLLSQVNELVERI